MKKDAMGKMSRGENVTGINGVECCRVLRVEEDTVWVKCSLKGKKLWGIGDDLGKK